MTIASSQAKAGPFIADGETSVYPFPFKVLAPDHVTVASEGDIPGYDVQVLEGGGNVVFHSPVPEGTVLTILRNVPITQETDLQNHTAFLPEVMEDAFDKLTMICQQLAEELDRCLKSDATDENGVQSLIDSALESRDVAVAAANRAAVSEKASAESAEASAESAEASAESAESARIAEEKVVAALEKSAGRPIGDVFSSLSSIPQEGSYLLNGQTIHNCRELYPKFWEWLTENAGETVATPVYKPWTMPALTADGTVGGAEYAVEASGAMVSGYEAYKSFYGTHGGAKTFACLDNVKSGYLTWYSPVKLKISSLFFQNATAVTAAELVKTFEIFGSNDNQTWHSLTTGTVASTAASATQTVDISESKYNADNPGYQYFKFEVANGGGEDIEFPEITIYGQEYLYTDYAGNGNILTVSNDAYEYTLSRTGVCGGFVIDSAAGSVRLPTLINGTLWGADSSNIGQSLAAGLPNIEGKVTSVRSSNGGAHKYTGAFYDDGSRGECNQANGGSYPIAISFDASLSNPIYGNSDTVQPPAIRVSWCIQVFNAATALSEQESAQLASLMQMKAQTDFGNVAENLDFVIESWNDGAGNWYRKYRSGWIEQGGVQSGANAVTVTLFTELANHNYAVRVTGRGESTRAYTLGVHNQTVTGFSVHCGTGTNAGVSATFSGELEWEAKGYAK